ncbi:hypothetical protein D3C71_1808380 [compost metagenome]
MGNPIHSTMLSSMDTSRRLPSPVFWRSSKAFRMAEYAYMPAAISAMEHPALTGSSCVPVTDRKPLSLWISRSYAFLSWYGPPSP